MSRAPRPSGARRDWGTDEDGCSILHVDMDAFFASVELARRPQLRGRPVIVGGSERAVVLAATYEARAFGVHSAMPMQVARRMCPQAVVIGPDHQAYRAVSARVMEIVGEVTTLVEQVSVDEAFLDVSGARRRLGPPTVIAAMIRERVRVAHGITCSVGIAGTKFVAKLASGLAKPDGVLLIPRDATVEFLRTLPVGSLWGVGERTEAALARWGLRTVADVADSDVATIQRAVGKVAGAHLHDLAWGRDPRPVTPGRVEKSIGAETTFPADVADLELVQAKAQDLAQHCASRLRSEGLVTRTVSIKVRTSDFRTLTRARTLTTPTDIGREIYLVARKLLAGVELGGLPVRLVGVRAEGLSPATSTAVQPTLEQAVDEMSERSRRADAERAMDVVRGRFGRAAIQSASAPSVRVRSGSGQGTPTTASAHGDLS